MSRDPLPVDNEINMTPLMDLTFILLITFIITFPLIENTIPIQLPSGEARQVEAEVNSLSISIDQEGRFYLDDRVMESAELLTQIQALAMVSPDVQVMLRGDERVVYGKVVEVIRLLREANITSMQLVTKEGD